MQTINKTSGLLIFLSFIFAIYSYFIDENFKIISVVFIWSAAFLLFFSLNKRKLLIILLILSFFAFLVNLYNDYKIDYKKAFDVNLYLLILLVAVSFLKLIATPRKEKNEELPNGKKSFLKTYFSVHLFGSVINLSALLIVADKMYKKAKLSPSQIVLLTRSFSSDAYWSPFFVAFAAASTYAPNLNTLYIISFGLFLAFFAFLITYFEAKKKFNLDNFYGYPLSFGTLYIPIILAILVLVSNYFYKDAKTIVLISFFAFLLTVIILPIKKGFINSFIILKNYILNEMPKMRSEISLFLVAGLFGIILGSILSGVGFKFPFEVFDYKVASFMLFIFIILSFIGIHPIISISVLGDFFIGVNDTLLAMTFLMAWATTVSTSPISGLNLTLSSRYLCDAKEVFKLNIFYAVKIYFICVLFLYLMDSFL